MKQRIAYVWLPRLETDRITRANLSLRDKPLAVVCETHNGCCLHAINAPAQLAGLTPGMMLPAARTICPGLITRPMNIRADQQTIAKLAQTARAFTPLIARDGLNGLFLGITGCAHLFGGERAMLKTINEKYKTLGFDAFTALADTSSAAWALARFGKSQHIAPPNQTREHIANLPVAGLRLDMETTETLNSLGLKKIKDLLPLPRASLAARFGIEITTRLDQVLGTAPEPLDFDREAKPYKASLRFAEPIVILNDVETSLDHLLEKLCAHFEKDNIGARKLVLTLTRVDNTTASIEIGTVAPTRTPKDLKRLFKDKLDKLDAGFGFERITLQATTVNTLTERQTELTQTSANASPERAGLINRLANRLGPGSLKTYAPFESHMPERAFKVTTPTTHPNLENAFAQPSIARPLRLFQNPIRIHFETPSSTGNNDHRTRSKTMTIFNRTHIIENATGPERIAAEWWHTQPLWPSELREYWWITDNSGQRFWVFKHRDATGQTTWHLHGLDA